MSGATISNYERGETQIACDELPKVAEALGVHPGDFFIDEPGPTAAEMVGTPSFRSPAGQEARIREAARALYPAWRALSDEERSYVQRAVIPAAEEINRVLLGFGAALLQDDRAG